MNNTTLDKAVRLAASHFLSAVPNDATAEDIFLALQADELPEGYREWGALSCDMSEVEELIRILADDFVNFAKLVDKE